MEAHASAEKYIQKHARWQKELTALREILLVSGMEETIKWGAPVYTVDGKNVVGLGAFKSYVGIWFFQGVFLKDPLGVLINAQENKTKALRQWRFASLDEINANADRIREYVQEAIENQKKGLMVRPDRKKPLEIPEELRRALDADAGLKQRFEALSRGKQREYAEYIAEAKREETRRRRLDRIIPMIREGIGLNDRYKGKVH